MTNDWFRQRVRVAILSVLTTSGLGLTGCSQEPSATVTPAPMPAGNDSQLNAPEGTEPVPPGDDA